MQICLAYILGSRTNPGERYMHNFNEWATLIVAQFFIVFNMVSVEDNFMVGYVVIGIIGAYCGVIFLIIIWNLC